MSDDKKVIAVGDSCPADLLKELTGSDDIYDAIDIVRPLLYCNSCYVCVVRTKRSGKTAVVKSYFKWKMAEAARRQVDLEIALHKSLVHPNSVSFWLAFDDGSQRHIVMEYCSRGNLRAVMAPMSECNLRQYIVKPLLSALAHLQDAHIVHRDLKPENIFLTSDGKVKLGDYGLAVLDPSSSLLHPASSHSSCMDSSGGVEQQHPYSSDGGQLHHTTSRSSDASSASSSSSLGSPCHSSSLQAGGTPAYTAPEVIKAAMHNTDLMRAISTKNDVWALGVITLEALNGQHPYAHPQSPSGTVMCTVASGNCITIPRNGISGRLRSFLSDALQQDPHKRSSARELLDHPWVTDNQLPLSTSSSAAAAGTAAAVAAAVGGAVAVAAAVGGGSYRIVGSPVGEQQQQAGWGSSTGAAAAVVLPAAADGSSLLPASLVSCTVSGANTGGSSSSPWGLAPVNEPCALHKAPPVPGAGTLLIGVAGVPEGESPRASCSLTDVLPFLKRSNGSFGQPKEPSHFLETIDSWEY